LSLVAPVYKPSWHTGRRPPQWKGIRDHSLAAYLLWERGGTRVYNQQNPSRYAGLTFGAGSGWIDSLNGPALRFAANGVMDLGVGRIGPAGMFAGAGEVWTTCVRFKVAASVVGIPLSRWLSTTQANQTFDMRFNRPGSAANTPFITLRGSSTGTSWGLDDNEWHTVWVTWNGSTARAYYDSAKGATTLTVGAAAEETGAIIEVGAAGAIGTPQLPLAGDIDFFALLDIPLSTAEIARWNGDLYAPWRPYRRRFLPSRRPPMEIPRDIADQRVRVELQTDVLSNGGRRLASLPMIRLPIEKRSLSGEHTIQFSVPLDHPAVKTIDTPAGKQNFRINQVIRLSLPNGDWSEHRITSSKRKVGPSGRVRDITAVSIREDLAKRGYIKRTYPDGHTTTEFPGLGMTMREHLEQFFLPAMSAGGQDNWRVGFLVHDRSVDVNYSSDSCESGLGKLAEAGGDLETYVSWDDQGYYINIVKQVAAGQLPLDVYCPRNLLDLEFTEQSDDQANRIVPIGSTLDDIEANAGQAQWEVRKYTVNADGTTDLWLSDPAGGDPPIAFDGQFLPYAPTDEGDEDSSINATQRYYLMITSSQDDWTKPILATFALNEIGVNGEVMSKITVDSTVEPPLGPGGRTSVKIVASEDGAEVTHLDNPQMVIDYGVHLSHLDRSDVPPTTNLIANPLLRRWGPSSTVPEGWGLSTQNTDILSTVRETRPQYWEYGGKAMRVSMIPNGTFPYVITPYTSIPIDAGTLSFFGRVIVLSGAVRVSLVLNRPGDEASFLWKDGQSRWVYEFPYWAGQLVGEEEPHPDLVSRDLNTAEDIGLESVWDLSKLPLFGGACAVVFRPAQDVTQTEFIILGAQLTVSRRQMPLLEGSGGVRLHQSANRRLAVYGRPATIVSANMMDLAQINGLKFPYEKIRLGGAVRVTELETEINALTRVVGYTRDWQNETMPNVELSQERKDITTFLTSRRWTARQRPSTSGIPIRGKTYDL